MGTVATHANAFPTRWNDAVSQFRSPLFEIAPRLLDRGPLAGLPLSLPWPQLPWTSPLRSSRMSRANAVTGEARTLLVASTGGHLAELLELSARIEMKGRPLWVTFDTAQSRSALAGRDVEYVRFTAPRDVRNVFRNMPAAWEILSRHNIVEAVSTGSAVALSFLPLARLRGIPCHYIESAARSNGPSVTGRALAAVPGTQLYTQYASWQNRRWKASGSVFDQFTSSTAGDAPLGRLNVFVAIGTLPYRFDRLIERIATIADPAWDFTWQTGPNRYGELPGTVHDFMSVDAFDEACASADVIIAHAGVGTSLAALEQGKHPILVARSARFHEHVDEHQRMVAEELAMRGLAFNESAETLTAGVVRRAANLRVLRTSGPKIDLVPVEAG